MRAGFNRSPIQKGQALCGIRQTIDRARGHIRKETARWRGGLKGCEARPRREAHIKDALGVVYPALRVDRAPRKQFWRETLKHSRRIAMGVIV